MVQLTFTLVMAEMNVPGKELQLREEREPLKLYCCVEGEGRAPQKGVMGAGGWEQPFLLSLCSEATHGVRIAACHHRKEKVLERSRSWKPPCNVISLIMGENHMLL